MSHRLDAGPLGPPCHGADRATQFAMPDPGEWFAGMGVPWP